MTYQVVILLAGVFLVNSYKCAANTYHNDNVFGVSKGNYRYNEEREKGGLYSFPGIKKNFQLDAADHNYLHLLRMKHNQQRGFQKHYHKNNYDAFYNHLNSDRKENKDRQIRYSHAHETGRIQNRQLHREKSIADYVEKYNYKNKKHSSFHTSRDDIQILHKPAQEIILQHDQETEGNYKLHFPNHGSLQESSDYGYLRDSDELLKEQNYNEYDNIDYDSNDNSEEKEIDPELIALYAMIARHYRKLKMQRPNEKISHQGSHTQHKVEPYMNALHRTELRNTFSNLLQNEREPKVMMRHQNKNKHTFSGSRVIKNTISSQQIPFKSSYQFYKYSEPDPLYHPNKNPFEFYHHTHLSNPSLTKIRISPTSTTKKNIHSLPTQTSTPNSVTEDKNDNFPTPVNVQLPPPQNNYNTKMLYVAATEITPSSVIITESKAKPISLQEATELSGITGITTQTFPMEMGLNDSVDQKRFTKVAESESHTRNPITELDPQNNILTTEGTNFFFIPTVKPTIVTENSAENENHDYPTDNTKNPCLFHPEGFTQINNPTSISDTSLHEGKNSTRYDSNSTNNTDKVAPQTSASETSTMIHMQVSNISTSNKYLAKTISQERNKHTNNTVLIYDPQERNSKFQQNILINAHDNDSISEVKTIPDTNRQETDSAGHSKPGNNNIQGNQSLLSSSVQKSKDNNIHYIMTIINEARSHQILSENNKNMTIYD